MPVVEWLWRDVHICRKCPPENHKNSRNTVYTWSQFDEIADTARWPLYMQSKLPTQSESYLGCGQKYAGPKFRGNFSPL